MKDLFKKKTSFKKAKKDSEHTYTTLSEVMNRRRDISFFYSGVEYGVYLDGCYKMGIRNFLMSYHYLCGRGLGDIFNQYPDIHLFVDSGAFTYQADEKYEEYTVEEWENHIEKYLRWAERNKEHIFAIANLDLERLVGAEQVKEWNETYFEPFMLRTGIPVCFVYHESAAYCTWEKYCERYPYVGFSSIADGEALDIDEYREYLRIAEKHDTLVHGFGMTKIRELSELPYYTVDSTTWKVGMRYGKLLIFDGRNIRQIAKIDWDTKALPLIQNYPIGIDIDKLWDYDEPEVIRANVYAFTLAEDYIKRCVKHLQYWKKAKTKKWDIDNLPNGFFPSVEWLKDPYKTDSEVKAYAAKFNINPIRDSINDVALAVVDLTSFVNWYNPVYEEMHECYTGEKAYNLYELHDTYINKIAPDDETKIKDLIKFYRECLSGERDTLLQEGTNFDRVLKERDDYVDDTEYVEVPLSENDIRSRLGNLLTSSEGVTAEEIDSLDKEIFAKENIKVEFDKNGHFVKGNQLVKKAPNIYSKRFPKIACDTCHAAAKCPEYKSGYVCAYHKMFNAFNTRKVEDVMEAMHGMADYNLGRMQRAMVMETINGITDPVVTDLINQNMRLMSQIQTMQDASNATVLKQTREVRADGTVSETTAVTNPHGGGIIEQLFKKSAKSNEPEPEQPKEGDVIIAEVPSEEVDGEIATFDETSYNET